MFVRTLPLRLSVVIIGILLCAPTSALACATCFGDPDSEMVKGAQAGILFLGVVTFGMLTSIAGVAGCWALRARKLAVDADCESHPS